MKPSKEAIEAEADIADHIRVRCNLSVPREHREAILDRIQSAIEKATEVLQHDNASLAQRIAQIRSESESTIEKAYNAGYEHGMDDEAMIHIRQKKSAQPQRSERKEGDATLQSIPDSTLSSAAPKVQASGAASSEQQEFKSAEALARFFHDTYEMLAPSFGYETRPDTREFDPESKNGRLMATVCGGILVRINAALAAEREKGFREAARIYKSARDEDRQALLAAQAAIEKLHDHVKEASAFSGNSVDLSALREHDAEVIDRTLSNCRGQLDAEIEKRKSLVEALEIFRKHWPQTHKAIRSEIMLGEAAENIHQLAELYRKIAALASVKEGE